MGGDRDRCLTLSVKSLLVLLTLHLANAGSKWLELHTLAYCHKSHSNLILHPIGLIVAIYLWSNCLTFLVSISYDTDATGLTRAPSEVSSTARNQKEQFSLANRFDCGRTAVSRSVRLSTKAVHSQSFGISCKGGIACRTREGTNSRRPDIFTKERISSASGNIAEKPVFGFSASMTNKEQRWCLKSNNHHHPYIGSMAAW